MVDIVSKWFNEKKNRVCEKKQAGAVKRKKGKQARAVKQSKKSSVRESLPKATVKKSRSETRFIVQDRSAISLLRKRHTSCEMEVSGV